MKNHTVSDIFCLTSQTQKESKAPEQLFSVKGCASSRLRRRDYLNSDVFPAGCLGNAADENVEEMHRIAKQRERLSYDEQERAMNILTKIHTNRKLLDRKESDTDLRMTVRRTAPTQSDFEYLMKLTKAYETTGDVGGPGDHLVREILSANELRFIAAIMLKKDSTQFFVTRLRSNSSPSQIYRNPITGHGMEDNSRKERKRNFDSVIKFMGQTNEEN